MLHGDDAAAVAAERGIVPGSVVRVKDAHRRNRRTIEVTDVLATVPETGFMIIKGRRVMAAFDRPMTMPNGYLVYSDEKVHSWSGKAEVETGVTEHRGLSLA